MATKSDIELKNYLGARKRHTNNKFHNFVLRFERCTRDHVFVPVKATGNEGKVAQRMRLVTLLELFNEKFS